jgi:hypothetical protein
MSPGLIAVVTLLIRRPRERDTVVQGELVMVILWKKMGHNSTPLLRILSVSAKSVGISRVGGGLHSFAG